MTTYSMFYTGNKAHMVKRGDGDFVMQPNDLHAGVEVFQNCFS